MDELSWSIVRSQNKVTSEEGESRAVRDGKNNTRERRRLEEIGRVGWTAEEERKKGPKERLGLVWSGE